MMKEKKLSRIALMLGTLALVVGVSAANAFAAGPGAVTMTVTAVGKKDVNPPAVTKEDVQFFLNKERTQVANWRRGEKLYLAVLIDDSLDVTVANQWNELKEFFNARRSRTLTSGRSTLPMPSTGRADSSAPFAGSRISAGLPKKQALSPIISALALPFPSSLILMSWLCTSPTNIF